MKTKKRITLDHRKRKLVAIKMATILIAVFLVVSCTDRPSESLNKNENKISDTNKLYKNLTKGDSVEDDVVKFASDYLMKKNLLKPWISGLKKPISTEKIRKLFYLVPLEKRSYDTVEVSLFKFGTYSNEDEDRVLIKKTTNPKFQVIGDSTREYDIITIHRFIKQYNNFSDSIKLKLYEFCIDSYTYEKTYIE